MLTCLSSFIRTRGDHESFSGNVFCMPGDFRLRSNKIDYNGSSRNLSLGMSKSQVSSVLGEPRRTDVNEDRERWIYWNRTIVGFTPIDNEMLAQDRLVVTFKEGKVSRWGNQTLADDVAEASQKAIDSSYKAAREMQKPSP